MELLGYSTKQKVLFNMVNERFESLANTEIDLQRVFQDVLPRLQRYAGDVVSVYTYADNVRWEHVIYVKGGSSDLGTKIL